MDQTTQPLQCGAIKMQVDGDQLSITHHGKAGAITVSIAAARLEKWATNIVREEAFKVTPEVE